MQITERHTYLVFAHVLPKCHVLILFSVAIPEFNVSLSAYSDVNSITVSWVQPQFEPTYYTLTSVCWLPCNSSALTTIVPTLSASDTSTVISGLPPGSECNITLTAIYNASSNTPLNLLTTTLSECTFLQTQRTSFVY